MPYENCESDGEDDTGWNKEVDDGKDEENERRNDDSAMHCEPNDPTWSIDIGLISINEDAWSNNFHDADKRWCQPKTKGINYSIISGSISMSLSLEIAKSKQS